MALLAVDDDGLGFSLAGVDPESGRSLVQAEVDALIREGRFAAALYEARP